MEPALRDDAPLADMPVKDKTALARVHRTFDPLHVVPGWMGAEATAEEGPRVGIASSARTR